MRKTSKIKNTIVLRQLRDDYIISTVYNEMGQIVNRFRYRGSVKDNLLQRLANKTKRKVIYYNLETTKQFKPKFNKKELKNGKN